MAQSNKKTNQSTAPKSIYGVNRRAAQKKKKTIIISAVSAVLLIAIIVTVVIISRRNSIISTTRITSYNIDEITYGNVSTTISGSGSLSPIGDR